MIMDPLPRRPNGFGKLRQALQADNILHSRLHPLLATSTILHSRMMASQYLTEQGSSGNSVCAELLLVLDRNIGVCLE